MKITPVILSGGGGTRLWPISTPPRPKQFLALAGDTTMFQMTLSRVADRDRFEAPIVVGNAAHMALITAQLAEAGSRDARIICEPWARNTAPAIALAALAADAPPSLLLVMPSDHVITDVTAFHDAIAQAATFAADGWLVTFGIEPTGPETGYGYIQTGEALSAPVRRIARFIEKPDAANAQAMLDQGGHVWNSGIFLFRADIYLGHLASLAPGMLSAAQKAMANAGTDGAALHPNAEAFAASPADSIDYAVMEKADRVAVVPVSMGWSDVGSWDALYDIRAKDAADNALSGEVRIDAATGHIVHAEGVRVTIHGVDDLIVVANGREVIILPRGKSQKVRDFATD